MLSKWVCDLKTKFFDTRLRVVATKRDEAEITPQMIEAGLGALYEYQADEVMENSTRVVRDVFSSMLLASRQPRP